MGGSGAKQDQTSRPGQRSWKRTNLEPLEIVIVNPGSKAIPRARTGPKTGDKLTFRA